MLLLYMAYGKEKITYKGGSHLGSNAKGLKYDVTIPMMPKGVEHTTIEEREAELNVLKEEKSKLPERVNVSSLEDYRFFERIDDEGKYLFNFVTGSACNVCKQMVDWLRPMFNQENEVVDLFYAITHGHGWIKSTSEKVTVRLEPLQQPKHSFSNG